MTIREKGYHQWEGQLNDKNVRWLPMFFYGIRLIFRKRFSKALFTFCIIPFFFYLGTLWISNKSELQMLKRMFPMISFGPDFFNSFFTHSFTFFMLLLLSVFFGSDLISNDIQYKSFPLYFSRPLERKDYLIGKFSILLFYNLLFTLVPGILLYIFNFIFAGDMSFNLVFVGGLLIVPVLTSLFIASVTLVISSMSSNSRYVKIIMILFFFTSPAVAEILRDVFRNSYFELLNFFGTIQQMGTFLLGGKPEFSFPAWISVLEVVLIILGSMLLLYRRIGKLEAQLESGN